MYSNANVQPYETNVVATCRETTVDGKHRAEKVWNKKANNFLLQCLTTV